MGLRMRAMERRVRQLEECLESAKRALQEPDEFPEKLTDLPPPGVASPAAHAGTLGGTPFKPLLAPD
jgi:hypothetical protein